MSGQWLLIGALLIGALLIGVLLQNKTFIIVLFNSERLSDKRFSVSARYA